MAPPTNPKRTGGAGGGGGGRGKPPTAGAQEPRKRGFRVGPSNAPKDAYLGKAKKIKENLIKNAKLKQQFAKTLKAEGLTSTRLERDPSLASSSRTSKGKGKGKGKGKERPADEDVAMDDDDANDSEGSAADAPSAGGGGGAVQQQARTDLSDLPHDDSSTARSYRPHARRPMAVHSAAAAGPNGGAGRSSRGEGGRPSVHDGTTTTPTPVATARWAPAKDAKGRARQPKMADKMDAMLAKIRKGL